MKINLTNKLTICRIVLTLTIIVLLCFPFYELGINFPNLEIMGYNLHIDYLIAGLLFAIASLTDYLDGYIARRDGLVTNTGKMLDAIADKILVNSVLIILASDGQINAIIPVVIVLRDVIVNAIKMEAASRGKVVAAIKSGKLKTATLMIGVLLVFFGNIPFEFIGRGIRLAEVFLWFATIMSLVSLYQYYSMNKKLLTFDN